MLQREESHFKEGKLSTLLHRPGDFQERLPHADTVFGSLTVLHRQLACKGHESVPGSGGHMLLELLRGTILSLSPAGTGSKTVQGQ